mmetsp:Transcript_19327/g.49414  ORF Transcript_19327/g.49414 Transcript_19327/m.49414 type:complete len:104 (-) Transcript_19327:187-498(-)
MAAYFPDKPTTEQSNLVSGFVRALGMMYPCSHCAADFREGMEESPPRVGSRTELSIWMCEAHNRVNRALGKPLFSCKLEDLDARWRTGGQQCDETSLAQEGGS